MQYNIFKKLGVAVGLVLGLSAISAPALAGIPTFDGLNLAQWLMQSINKETASKIAKECPTCAQVYDGSIAAAASQDLQNKISEQIVKDTTGNRGLSDLLSGNAEALLNEKLGKEWVETFKTLSGDQNSIAKGEEIAKSWGWVNDSHSAAKNQLAATLQSQEQSAKNNADFLAKKEQTIDKLNDEIGKTTDQKGALELIAKLQVETMRLQKQGMEMANTAAAQEAALKKQQADAWQRKVAYDKKQDDKAKALYLQTLNIKTPKAQPEKFQVDANN